MAAPSGSAYVSTDQLKLRYEEPLLAQLTDPDGAAVIDTTLVWSLKDAAAEVDSYLGRRYTLPLPVVPSVLVRINCDIAVYRLMTLRRLGDTEDQRLRYKDAIKFLESIASGTVDLTDDSGSPLGIIGQGGITGSSSIVDLRPAVFDFNQLADYRQDGESL